MDALVRDNHELAI